MTSVLSYVVASWASTFQSLKEILDRGDWSQKSCSALTRSMVKSLTLALAWNSAASCTPTFSSWLASLVFIEPVSCWKRNTSHWNIYGWLSAQMSYSLIYKLDSTASLIHKDHITNCDEAVPVFLPYSNHCTQEEGYDSYFCAVLTRSVMSNSLQPHGL